MPRSSPREVVIGLDVGTSSTKAVAFGPSGWSRGTSRDYPLHSPEPGRQEQDPHEVAAAVTAALTDLVDRLDGIPIAGVSTSAAMHGLVGIGHDRQPVTPLVTWADGRATEDARVLATEHPELSDATGTPMHPMTPLATLRWFAREQPETAGSVRWWLGLKDWVLLRLTGELVAERSSASGMGLLDRATGRWHDPALSAAGITTAHLPDLVDVDHVLGLARDVADRTGLLPGLPVVVGAADGPLGNLGVGAVDPGIVGLSVGTSAAARMVVHPPPDRLDAGLFCYLLDQRRWVVGGATSTGGLAVEWAAGALAPDLARAGGDRATSVTADHATPAGRHLAAVLDLAAGVPAGSDGVVAFPHLITPRAPDWEPGIAAAWLGVDMRHGRAHLVRATIEAAALHLAEVVARLEALEDVREIRATGGALRAGLWREVVAGALARPLTLVGDVGGTALGAAALGWWALGRAGGAVAARAALVGDDHPTILDPDPVVVEALAHVRERRGTLLTALQTTLDRDQPRTMPRG